ncbi:hypothetical protein STFR1_10683 [Bacillus vallismortis]
MLAMSVAVVVSTAIPVLMQNEKIAARIIENPACGSGFLLSR